MTFSNTKNYYAAKIGTGLGKPERIESVTSEDYSDAVIGIFQAMGHAKRLRLLHCLSRANEITVNELATMTGFGQALTSQHLTKLYQADLVARRRESQSVYYSLKRPGILSMVKRLNSKACP